ncbi:MAG: carbohydrate binding domain-containing protein, partial [Planctomycetaceae bacterium]|nr:carbohydrate binding domain-containing protein [Planctomycetaceae bacterium]
IWGTGSIKTKMTLDKDQLDKLDYFVAALKKRGIYVNVNLHVSRSLDERDGFPPDVNRPSHDKGIDNYYRPFIEANKKYARDLLMHVNPYTSIAYKDDPCVAMIEINNENSIVQMWGGWGGLDVIQDPFLADLRKEWNAWLKNKYKNDDAVRKAWKSRSVPLGKELLTNGDFPNGYVPNWQGWSWETDSKTVAPISNQNGILKMDVKKKGEVDWHPQLIGSGFKVKKDSIYTIELKVKADKNTTISFGVRMNHAPWEGLGLDTQFKISPEWKTFKLTYLPAEDDDNARVGIAGFTEGTVYEIDFVSLKEGGNIGIPADASLTAGNIPVIWKKDAGQNPKEAVDDFCDFLLDIEARYWDEMYKFLKEEIKVKQCVSGTQLEYGGPHAQARMDYCDIHAYWNHPSFPGRAWDGNNWYLRNRALVNYADRQILSSMATKRVAGKPFTLSEYNHPYPNQYAGEGLPLLAAFGAFQGWDGIFPFAYSHSSNFEPQLANSFFDTVGNTVQMAHMIACHNFFVHGYNKDADAQQVVAPLSEKKVQEIFREVRHPWNFGFNGLGLDPRLALLKPVAIDTTAKAAMPKVEAMPKDQKVFETKTPLGYYRYNLEKPNGGFAAMFDGQTALFTGFVEEDKKYPLGNGSISFGKTNLGWATVTLTDISAAKNKSRLLLVLTGEMLNTDMEIEALGEDKITVGNRWGKPPVRCEGIPAVITWKNNVPLAWKCWSLDQSGERKKAIPFEMSGNECILKLSPTYKTIWYEITSE